MAPSHSRFFYGLRGSEKQYVAYQGEPFFVGDNTLVLSTSWSIKTNEGPSIYLLGPIDHYDLHDIPVYKIATKYPWWSAGQGIEATREGLLIFDYHGINQLNSDPSSLLSFKYSDKESAESDLTYLGMTNGLELNKMEVPSIFQKFNHFTLNTIKRYFNIILSSRLIAPKAQAAIGTRAKNLLDLARLMGANFENTSVYHDETITHLREIRYEILYEIKGRFEAEILFAFENLASQLASTPLYDARPFSELYIFLSQQMNIDFIDYHSEFSFLPHKITAWIDLLQEENSAEVVAPYIQKLKAYSQKVSHFDQIELSPREVMEAVMVAFRQFIPPNIGSQERAFLEKRKAVEILTAVMKHEENPFPIRALMELRNSYLHLDDLP